MFLTLILLWKFLGDVYRRRALINKVIPEKGEVYWRKVFKRTLTFIKENTIYSCILLLGPKLQEL